jgi:hypothetical protein
MIYTIIILQALDLVSTVVALRSVPNAYEANPVLNKLFKIFGASPTLVVVKTAFAVVLYLYRDLVMPEAQIVLCAIYAFVVFQNFQLLRHE